MGGCFRGIGDPVGAFSAILTPSAFSPSFCLHGTWVGGRWMPIPDQGCAAFPGIPLLACRMRPRAPLAPSSAGPGSASPAKGPGGSRQVQAVASTSSCPGQASDAGARVGSPAGPAVLPPIPTERHLPGAQGRCWDLNPIPDACGTAQRCCSPSPVPREGCRPLPLQAGQMQRAAR